MIKRTLASLLPLCFTTTFLLSGCKSVTEGTSSVTENIIGVGADRRGVVPDRTFMLTPSTSIALEKIVFWGAYAGVAYLILDPLAPNWEIEETRLDPTLVHFNLKMKRYYTGGQGEARMVFNRRAKEIMRVGDFASYEIVEYNESLESSILGSQRVTQGVIRLIPKA